MQVIKDMKSEGAVLMRLVAWKLILRSGPLRFLLKSV